MSTASLPKLLLALALLGGIAFAVRSRPIEVEGVRVVRGPVVDEVLGIGVLESAHEAPLAFEASGRVTALAVDEGDRVVAGQVLGSVDVARARRELDVSQATAAAAAADLTRARADVERGRATADLAARELARVEALVASGDVTPAQHDAAVERDASARATLRSLEAALARATSGVDAARGGARIREAQVADGALVSPVTGLVVRRTVEVGQWVAAGAPAFTVVADDAFEVRAWVDEAALGRLAVGQPVRLAFRSDATRTYAGRVARLAGEVDRRTHELLVDVTVLEVPTQHAVGQRADAWIEVGRRDDVTSVPRGWCDTTCLVAADDRVERRPVELGLVGRDAVEIGRGLAPGDVVLPPTAPAEGRRVRVMERP